MRLTNRGTIIAAVVLVVVAGGIYLSLTGLPYKRSQIADEVKAYLIHIRAYPEADIQAIRGVYSLKSGDYEAEVRYKDEPDQHYTYAKVNGVFRLVGVSSMYGRHIDETFY
ncbi:MULTISPECIES: DUF3139 domain-containing protein [unclassified Paenibacillus]|uniref:DUF3139 domain-containing protein n=1 Tax=unclassified Paenibacillus TaxID=185978 RepID=UPI0030FA43ED